MTPTSRGAFCSACAKDVVDFTTMTDVEVQHYLLNKAGEKVCGKFSNTQLHRIRINIPNYIFYAKIAGWKKFMAVVMLAFGSMLFGCDVTTDNTAKVDFQNNPTQVVPEIVGNLITSPLPPIDDSLCIAFPYTLKGEPAMIEAPSITTIGYTQPVIMGDMEVKPVLPDTTESYEMVGDIIFVDTTIQKTKKDSLPKPKIQNDSSDCPEKHFY